MTLSAPLALTAGLEFGAMTPGSTPSANADATSAFALPGYERLAGRRPGRRRVVRTASGRP